MLDSFLTIAATLSVLYLLLAVLFPDHCIPSARPKRLKYGASHWGVYDGCDLEETEELKRIEPSVPARRERVVAGSSMYAGGRGISFRR